MTTRPQLASRAPAPVLPLLRRALRRESGLFGFGVVVIALHVLDDSFLQPSPGHVGGLAARPAEYERRVIGFFDDALLRSSRHLNAPAGCAKLHRP